MKERSNNNLTEPFEKDELDIKASMDRIEPEAGARERMLQNIMKKAAMTRASEEGGKTEAPKAEILSVTAGKKASGKSEKNQKNRWKYYVPMLIAAGLIMTVGLIFFASYSIRGGNSMAKPDEDAYSDGNNHAGGDMKNWEEPCLEPDDVMTREAIPPVTSAPADAAPPGMPEHPDEPLYPTDFRPEHNQENEQRMETSITGTGDGGSLAEEWSSMTPVREALLDAVAGMKIKGVRETDSIVVSADGHEYSLRLLRNAREAADWSEDVQIEEKVHEGEDSLTLLKVTNPGSGFTLWYAEWNPVGADWYYLENTDDASQEAVLGVIARMKKNSGEEVR